MKSLLAFSALGLLLPCGLQAASHHTLVIPHAVATIDSIGVEQRDGKRFVLHRVNQGQTLFAIARRYNVPVEEIKAANPAMTDAVQYNQVVRVPQPERALSRREQRAAERAARREERTTEDSRADEQLMKPSDPAGKPSARSSKKEPDEDTKATQRSETDARKGSDTHTVESGQTLYSLAVRYNVLMADLRRWNNLSSDNIQSGQTLIVSERGYLARNTPRPAANEPNAPEASTRPDPTPKPVETKPAEPKAEPSRRETTRTEPKPEPAFKPDPTARPETNRSADDRPIRPGESGNNLPTKGRRIAEIGMAERIDSDDSSNKYLALHRTAPVGSLIQVRNDISNQSLWVKVVGRLPNTGVNERVLIKLSAKAFEKLSPNNQSFRAEVSYMVP